MMVKKKTKKELAEIAKASGQKYFYADCKKHGEGVEHLTSCRKCNLCIREKNRQDYEENRESRLEYARCYSRYYYEENRESRLEYSKRQSKQYYRGNKEAILGRMKKYYGENKAYKKKYQRQYYEENRESRLEHDKQYSKHYRKRNSLYISLRATLSRLGDDGSEWFSGITREAAEVTCGYSQEEFTRHIESTFKPDMSWENRSEWHIDHILPVVWFRDNGITNGRIINALPNLRAEWASDNKSKGSKWLEEGFTEQEWHEMLVRSIHS